MKSAAKKKLMALGLFSLLGYLVWKQKEKLGDVIDVAFEEVPTSSASFVPGSEEDPLGSQMYSNSGGNNGVATDVAAAYKAATNSTKAGNFLAQKTNTFPTNNAPGMNHGKYPDCSIDGFGTKRAKRFNVSEVLA